MQRPGGCKLFVCMAAIGMSASSLHRESTDSLIIVVCSDKSVYTKFYLDWLLREWAKGHLHPYRDVWPEAVYCKNYIVCILTVRGCYHVTKFCSTTLSSL